jgi:hypothetical protein
MIGGDAYQRDGRVRRLRFDDVVVTYAFVEGQHDESLRIGSVGGHRGRTRHDPARDERGS